MVTERLPAIRRVSDRLFLLRLKTTLHRLTFILSCKDKAVKKFLGPWCALSSFPNKNESSDGTKKAIMPFISLFLVYCSRSQCVAVFFT